MQEMVNDAHAALVQRLAKPGKDVKDSMTAQGADQIHAIMGIVGEAGELLDAVKKSVIYNKPLDRDNVIEELGDIEFYLQQLRANLGISRIETLHANISKLNKRYPAGGYSDKQAQGRADKGAA